jgi:hypothetical protein
MPSRCSLSGRLSQCDQHSAGTDEGHANPVAQVEMFAEKGDTEDGDQNNAELVDWSDPGSVTER